MCAECELELTPYSCAHAIVHKCLKCHGLWFDEKRIALFRDTLSTYDFSDVEIESLPSDFGSYVIRGCPRCDEVLSEENYGYNSKVKVFRCSRCRGVWMPLLEMVHLMESVRIGQITADDVRGLLYELGLAEKEMQMFRNLERISRLLCTPVRGGTRLID